MKYFRLAGADFRKQIDLRLYRSDIEEAVKKVKPNAKVIVRQSYFTTIPDLGKRESIAVSATLRQHAMAELTSFRPCLFNSTPELTKKELEEEENGNNQHKQTMGGRKRNSTSLPSHQQKSHPKNDKRKP